jgi:hypothetical protein
MHPDAQTNQRLSFTPGHDTRATPAVAGQKDQPTRRTAKILSYAPPNCLSRFVVDFHCFSRNKVAVKHGEREGPCCVLIDLPHRSQMRYFHEPLCRGKEKKRSHSIVFLPIARWCCTNEVSGPRASHRFALLLKNLSVCQIQMQKAFVYRREARTGSSIR